MLQMERSDNRDADHIISIERRSNASSPSPDRHQDEEGASSSIELSVPQSSLASSNGANSRNSSFARRREGYGRRFSNGRWILIELVFTLSQIIASAIVLSLSRHVKPQVSLSAWVIGHASACVATLPLLYWRFLHRNQGTEQDSTQARQDAPRNNPAPEPSPFAATSVLRATDEEDSQAAVSSARNAESVGISARVNVLVDQFTIASHFFFVVWLFVGNIWILGFNGHSSSAEEPSLYRLSRFFLKICSIWYPFVYAICCCLPCTDFLGFHEDANHIRGAAAENINVLPTYGRSRGGWWDTNGDDWGINAVGVGEGGGTVAAGTVKERIILGEDVVCSICLAEYADNEKLRELPCAHFFHADCVDKWLKKIALCPLCKRGIGKNSGILQTSAVNPSHQH